MMVSPIDEEIGNMLHNIYSRTMNTAPSLAAFRELIAKSTQVSQDLAHKNLQPWLPIFDLGLMWLSYLHVALKSDSEGKKENQRNVAHLLVGAACSFGISLNQLCLQGFDVPAKSLLRTYTEILFLCIAMLHDESLCDEYANAQQPEEILDFWHKRASPRNLHSRICAIEKNMGLEDITDELKVWRKEEFRILSESAHLSYVAAAMSCFSPGFDAEKCYSPAIFGRATSNSTRTVSYAARTTWYFSRIIYPRVLGRTRDDNTILTLDRESEAQRFLVLGRDVLSEITMSHWNA